MLTSLKMHTSQHKWADLNAALWDRFAIPVKEQLHEVVPDITFSLSKGLQWVWVRAFDETHEQIWWGVREPLCTELLDFAPT